MIERPANEDLAFSEYHSRPVQILDGDNVVPDATLRLLDIAAGAGVSETFSRLRSIT